jgi:hypothetical protein
LKNITDLLKGGDLRSIGKSNSVAAQVKTQKDFDRLFKELSNPERIAVMRAADAIEKVTVEKPEFLDSHHKSIVALLDSAREKELKWHLAQIIQRVNLTEQEVQHVWKILSAWVRDKSESRIVRVFSLEALHIFSLSDKKLERKFNAIVRLIQDETIPSLQARIRKLRGRKMPE